MSLKCYCSQCGKLHEYTLQKPQFCEACGNSFNQSFANKTETKKADIINVKDDIEIKNSGAANLDASKLGVTIENFGAKNTVKFDESFGLFKNKSVHLNKIKGKRVNKKVELQKFQADAGLGGRKTIEIQDSGAE